MSLRTLFNKALIKSDLRRYWWILAIYMISQIIWLLELITNYDSKVGVVDYSDQGILAIFAAMFTGVIVFSYLHKGSAVSMFHGMPIDRKTQFVSHCFSGLLLVMIPIIITSAAFLAICVHLGQWHYGVKYFAVASVNCFQFFFIAVVSAIIAGNTIAGYVFTVGFSIVLPFLDMVISEICNNHLYGYPNSSISLFYYVYPKGIDNILGYRTLWNIALIIVLIVISYLLYKNRKLEYFDEIVVFKSLKYVFMYVVSICFGLFGYIIFTSMFNWYNLFLILPLGIVGVIGTYMLNNKSISIKGVAKYVVIYFGITVCIFSIFQFDLFGYEKRVPDINEVVEMEEPSYTDLSYCYSGYDYNIEDANKNKILYTDTKDIQSMIDWQKAIIANKGNEDAAFAKNTMFDMEFIYVLSNGDKMIRHYNIDTDNYKDYFSKYVNSKQYKYIRYPIIDDTNKSLESISYIESNKDGVDLKDVYINNIDRDLLISTMREDILNADFSKDREDCYSRLSIIYEVNPETNKTKNQRRNLRSIDVYLNKNMPKTKALVEKTLKEQ